MLLSLPEYHSKIPGEEGTELGWEAYNSCHQKLSLVLAWGSCKCGDWSSTPQNSMLPCTLADVTTQSWCFFLLNLDSSTESCTQWLRHLWAISLSCSALLYWFAETLLGSKEPPWSQLPSGARKPGQRSRGLYFCSPECISQVWL